MSQTKIIIKIIHSVIICEIWKFLETIKNPDANLYQNHFDNVYFNLLCLQTFSGNFVRNYYIINAFKEGGHTRW